MSPIPFALPPRLPDVVSTWTLSSYDALGTMRAGLTDAVSATTAERPLPDRSTVRNMLLASSELATNALKHARSSARVVLSTDGQTFLLDVVARARDSVPPRAAGRKPGEGGFGLVLVARVSKECGWYVSRDEKHIWATFPARDAG
jgi:serine/threonine-protein kinase RsbW